MRFFSLRTLAALSLPFLSTVFCSTAPTCGEVKGLPSNAGWWSELEIPSAVRDHDFLNCHLVKELDNVYVTFGMSVFSTGAVSINIYQDQGELQTYRVNFKGSGGHVLHSYLYKSNSELCQGSLGAGLVSRVQQITVEMVRL